MTQGDLDDSTVSVPIVAGLGLVATSVVFAGRTAAGVTVRISGYDVIALTAGTLAVGLGVWGLLAATRGAYRRGVGALSGSAGMAMVFLAPQARSGPLFVGTGAMILVLSGLFMIAEGLGYELVAVDDDEDGEASTAQESEMDA
ncbi:hypothetical protein [Halorhabdus sp. CUG00001]|uniref:hypothetical protein n=1 Tax=Halorhabdus sp. CUG00001 TaxID=2600297 RepID=UPI00131DFE5B|nr:hypothetical protein [Halorhabdus sp. CUG00001]